MRDTKDVTTGAVPTALIVEIVYFALTPYTFLRRVTCSS